MHKENFDMNAFFWPFSKNICFNLCKVFYVLYLHYGW